MSAALPERPFSMRHCLAAILIALVLPAGTISIPTLFAVMLVTLVVGLSIPDRAEHIRRLTLMAGFHPLGLLTVFTLLAWVPSIFSSPEPLLSIKTWARVCLVVFAAGFLWSVLDRNEKLQAITRNVLLASLAILLTAIIVAIHFYPDVILAMRNSDGPWKPYKAISSGLACLVPLMVWTAWTCRDWRRYAALLVVVLAVYMMVGSSSRSALAGLAVGVLVATVVLSVKIKKLRIPMAIGVVGFLVLVFLFLMNYAGDRANETAVLGVPVWLIDYHRQHIWHFVISKIPEAFWFGHGINALAHIPGADQNAPGLTVALVPSHPHNWFLEMFSETGIIGVAGVMIMIARFMVKDLLAAVRKQDMRALSRLCMFATFWASSCFNFSIWAPWWGVTFLLLTAIHSARPELPAAPKAKMLFTVTEGFAFLSHRLPMARAAQSAGYDTGVVCKPGDKTDTIQSHGVSVYPWNIKRAGTNPLREIYSLNALRKSYEKEQPALVHHVAVKPVLYGAIAACIAGVPMVVNAMIGLGFLFINTGQKATLLRKIVLFLLRLTLNRSGSVLLVQNPDDADLFAKSGVVSPERIALIPGSGVDAEHYTPMPEPEAGPIVVSVVSRMLWDKGIGETVEAAKILKDRGLDVVIRLVGGCDLANPQNIPEATLEQWKQDGLVVWNGPTQDIQGVWADSHIALLPSYREGMPKALLEAAACGRPLITTDAPGCRSLVSDGQNGLIVPLKDSEVIANAIARLVNDPEERKRMGADARQRIETVYAETIVTRDVAALYQKLQKA